MSNQYPIWAESRLLAAINFARTAEHIYQHPALQDDPSSGDGRGYVLGEKVAQRIIDYRAALARRRYENARQLLEVRGLGADKLNDLLFSFSTSADEYFRKLLFDGLLFDNWDVRAHSIQYDSKETFLGIANSGENFLRVAADLYVKTLSNWSEEAQMQLKIRMRYAYHENYFDGHIGAFQLALWWYTFDYDNWFSYEKMKLACEQYLGHHNFGREGMQLRVLRLQELNPLAEFQRDQMIPVIVNYPEQKITVWEVQLND
ncbi:MAG: hypothetical protein AAF849_00395 [Bacteroidota bacterium]